jgi:hypothetical protein
MSVALEFGVGVSSAIQAEAGAAFRERVGGAMESGQDKIRLLKRASTSA